MFLSLQFFVGDVIACNSEFRCRCFREEHNRVLDKRLVVSNGLADAIVNEREVPPEGEENVLFEMDREESSEETASLAERSVESAVLPENVANSAASPAVARELFSLERYQESGAFTSSCLFLLSHLLRTAPFTFGQTHA